MIRVRRWLREPLVHFLLAGMTLFGLSRVVGSQQRNGGTNRIELSEDDLRQLDVGFAAQWQRPPTPAEMRSLIDKRVREEILYREALALGLDKGDAIVKRRLAQKMEFLAEDVSGVRDPTTDELAAWFQRNGARFTLPPAASFRHLYFSPDLRGARARDAAASALARLARNPGDANAGTRDPFMFQDFYAERTPDQVASVFGKAFADALFQLPPSAWQGPLESGLGWHLVWVESITPGRIPFLEEIRPQVKAEWIAEQRAESRRKAFEVLQSRYQVVLPPTSPRLAAQ